MIPLAISTEDRRCLKRFADAEETVLGYHAVLGFVSVQGAETRMRQRRRLGLRSHAERWLCRFRVASGPSGVHIESLGGVSPVPIESGRWAITVGEKQFIVEAGEAADTRFEETLDLEPLPSLFPWILGGVAVAAVLLMVWLHPLEPVETLPPVTSVTIHAVRPKIVHLRPASVAAPLKLTSKAKTRAPARGAAVAQNLGFLKLLGSQSLKKAAGGPPLDLKQASPGAGAGGKAGSGGELLVGLGMGLKRASVGNSGVKGLGGVGARGAGGGAGGYGNALFGSGGMGNGLKGLGNGKALAAIPLSNDMVLEGGLDPSAIQATIAKYLSQIRNCYERGLQQAPGLAGQVTMDFEIGAEGTLHYSRVKHSSLGNAQVESCIRERMLSWQFPKPLGGVDVKVSYPFLLRTPHQS